MKTRELTLTAVMAALLCLAGPLSIAVGPIPISLATFAVCLAGAVLGPKRGALAVAIYLLIGAIGVPVFAGFTAGVSKLMGVTGGFLVGYLPCAMLAGIGAKKVGKCPAWRTALVMAVGTVALYAIGTAWFMLQTKNPLASALALCVLPFLPGDAIKIAAATAIAGPVRRAAMYIT